MAKIPTWLWVAGAVGVTYMLTKPKTTALGVPIGVANQPQPNTPQTTVTGFDAGRGGGGGGHPHHGGGGHRHGPRAFGVGGPWWGGPDIIVEPGYQLCDPRLSCQDQPIRPCHCTLGEV